MAHAVSFTPSPGPRPDAPWPAPPGPAEGVIAAPTAAEGVELSVVVPLYNEEGSLRQLVEQLLTALRPLGLPFELVLVDDGSRDRTPVLLGELAAEVPELVAVLLRRNYGQSAAMAAGFDSS
ncbi:MAG: glycosyltransferase, partial [Cyanobacteriota bacterium]